MFSAVPSAAVGSIFAGGAQISRQTLAEKQGTTVTRADGQKGTAGCVFARLVTADSDHLKQSSVGASHGVRLIYKPEILGRTDAYLSTMDAYGTQSSQPTAQTIRDMGKSRQGRQVFVCQTRELLNVWQKLFKFDGQRATVFNNVLVGFFVFGCF